MLASLAMLAALRVAAGGSAPPIPSAARQGQRTARSGRESRPARRTGKQGLGQGRLDDIATRRLRFGRVIRNSASRFARVDSGRTHHQALASHAFRSRRIALRIVSIFRMQAVKATLAGRPASRRRAYMRRMTGLTRAATSAAM